MRLMPHGRPHAVPSRFTSVAWSSLCEASKTVLMVHGAGGGGWEFDFWQSEFEARGWRCVAQDLMPSPAGLAATQLSDYVDQVESWVPPSNDSLVLVGASMGGALALLASERLQPKAIVLVNSLVPPPWSRPTERSSRELPDVLEWAGTPLERTARAMPDSTADVQRWASERWRDESGMVMRALRDGFRAVTPQGCRTLFVVGEADRDVPAPQQLAWASAWGSPALVYRGMSHVGPLLGEQAPVVAREVAEWLDDQAIACGDS